MLSDQHDTVSLIFSRSPNTTPGRSAIRHMWTLQEDIKLRELINKHGGKKWKPISKDMISRSQAQCRQRWALLCNPNKQKRTWSSEENTKLGELVIEYGTGNWGKIAARLERRNANQCRERWYNQLNPNVVKAAWLGDEDRVILEMQARIGNRWAAIAKSLPGRTENAVKNRWHSSVKFRKLRKTAEENNKKLGPTQKYLPVVAATGLRLSDDELKDLIHKLHETHAKTPRLPKKRKASPKQSKKTKKAR